MWLQRDLASISITLVQKQTTMKNLIITTTCSEKKSSLLWISRVQRRIWLIAWNMWMHRNTLLHNNGKTIDSFEMPALDEEIQQEWDTGLDQLAVQHGYLFQGQVQHCLDDMVHHKLMWISSVWSARDNDIHIVSLCTQNEVIVNLYNRWQSKNSIDL
jgi:hypothetical protein